MTTLRTSARIREKAALLDVNSTLPEELIIEILLRLPVSSLMLFKCVSKSWYTIIRDQDFVNKHLAFTSSTSIDHLILDATARRVIRRFRGGSIYLVNYRTPEKPNNKYCRALNLPFGGKCYLSSIVDCCDGLLLVDCNSEIYLCNPAIKEYKKLPRPFVRGWEVLRYALEFDCINNDYKVLAFSYGDIFPIPTVEIKVFCMYPRSGSSWRQICSVPKGKTVTLISRSPVLVRGSFHWIGRTESDSSDIILSFDSQTGVFQEMALPWSFSDWCAEVCGNLVFLWKPSVLEKEVSLGTIVIEHYRVNVWVMKEYGVKESWTKLASIRIFSLNPYTCTCTVSGELILGQDAGGRNVSVVDVRTGEHKKILTPILYHITRALSYRESLVSVLTPPRG